MTITLGNLVTQRDKDSTSITCRLSDQIVLQVAVYASSRILDRLSPSPKSFLYFAYLVALKQQLPLVVTCEVDRFEWMNFRHNFAPLIQAFYSMPAIPVSYDGPPVHGPGRTRGGGFTGLMFSGGVDSFYSLLELPREGQKPDYLVSVNAGAFPRRSVWDLTLPRLADVSGKYGRPLILIDTNFHHVLPQPHLSSHTVRNMTAAMLLAPAVSTAVYSSSTTLADASFARAKEIQDMSSIEAVFLYTMQQADFGALIYGLNVERIDKTRAIMDDPVVQQCLNVCTNWKYQISPERTVINCGRCGKCARTMLTLDALGRLDKFAQSFELKPFRENRESLVEKLRQSHYRIDHAVVELLDGGTSSHG